MGSDSEEIADVIRCCLLTFKNGTKLAALDTDYKSMEGRSIPYRQLGFSNLEAFIQTVPGIKTYRRGADLWVESLPTRETAHISKLVAGQNPAKMRRRKSNMRQGSYNQGSSRSGVRAVNLGQQNSMYSRPAGNSNMRNNNPSLRPQATMPAARTQVTIPGASRTQVTIPGASRTQVTIPGASRTQVTIPGAVRPLATIPGASRPEATIPGASRPQLTIPGASRPRATVPDPKPLMSFVVQPLPSSLLTGLKREVGAPFAAPAVTPPKALQEDILSPERNAAKNWSLQRPPAPEDPRDRLKRIARQLGRPEPAYKIIPMNGKNGTGVFYARVEIGSAKFSSYPQEAESHDRAETLAANQALEELDKEYSKTRGLAQTTDRELVKKRLLQIVDQHNGVFIHKIPDFYQEQFEENLPGDWKDNIAHWHEVSLEKGVNDSVILCRADARLVDKAPELSPAIERGYLKPIYHLEPPHIELPRKNIWMGQVTPASTTVDIWVHLVGEEYSDKLTHLMEEMSRHYSTTTRCTEGIDRGGYYAMMENEMWHRVRVTDYDLTRDEAEISFIDLGDEDTVNASRLYPLDRKFFLLPAQAIRVSLAGLEDFADCESLAPIVDRHVLNRVYYMNDVKRDVDENGPTATVIMYDTHGPDDLNLNELLMKKFLHALTPRLEGSRPIFPVYVSHVETNGDVYVQVKHDALKVLVKMLNKLIEKDPTSEEERDGCALRRIDHRVTYLVKCEESGDWYRGRFVEFATDSGDGGRRLKMRLIDFGRTIVVEAGNVIQLDKLSVLLAEYPPQATRVRLDKVDPGVITLETVRRIGELAPPSQQLILKLAAPATQNYPPLVALFKKMPPDNILGSINITLVLENKCADEDGNNNVKPRKRVERTNSRSVADAEDTAKALRPPKIGDIGEYFDVHVTMAANPANFTVQPFDTLKELSNMMKKLQEACKSETGGCHPTLDSIKEGRLYAAQHTDGDWYRGCVLNVINEHMLTVYFVDYGDVAAMGLDKLMPLSKRFLDLPYQAIKARLVGIKPKRIDWSPEDCVRFQNLTVERDFVSIIAEVDADRHLPRDTVLGLDLIDVSTSEDVNIAEILVNEGRAVYND